MTVQLEMWQLIMLLLAFFGGVGAFGRVLLAQIQASIKQRFDAQEVLRTEAQGRWDQRFTELQKSSEHEARNWQRVERELLQLRADLPREYVRREDHIRFETVINAKLDAINDRFDLLLERQKKG